MDLDWQRDKGLPKKPAEAWDLTSDCTSAESVPLWDRVLALDTAGDLHWLSSRSSLNIEWISGVSVSWMPEVPEWLGSDLEVVKDRLLSASTADWVVLPDTWLYRDMYSSSSAEKKKTHSFTISRTLQAREGYVRNTLKGQHGRLPNKMHYWPIALCTNDVTNFWSLLWIRQ